ncbi:nucleoside-triphosphatase [Natroniella acetigena]|uniref:nucleoside-triphosphatase n=1 Tax=Natroniella acetigena TaxID=52004 RepID=UPI00200B1108|nr:nucleoside-triphosphatase [Natroniella acetigena]MCK8827287.1 nucleoside-triphosphatase [Natroniella acetigena]
MKNLFLTGEIKVGKSTILEKVVTDLELKVAGFKTLPYIDEKELQGFYIESMIQKQKMDSSIQDSLIAYKENDYRWTALIETFKTEGVEILKASLQSTEKVILMDELGFFESEAQQFQDYVIQCLDSDKVVIGVIKPLKIEFLDRIRQRRDMKIIEVTLQNRDQAYEKFKSLLKEVVV